VSLSFLIVGVFMLALASLQFLAPDLLSGWGPLSYGRLRPAAIHFVLYGWLTIGLIGAIYYAAPRLAGERLTDPVVARVGLILMSAGYALGGLGILAGQTEGLRYLEAPAWADLIVLVGLLAMTHSVVRTLATKNGRDRSPAEWFMGAAVVWLLGLHVVGNLSMLSTVAGLLYSQPPVLHGINGALVAGFYRVGIIGLWLATAGVGVLYFLAPRLVGLARFKATRMSVVGFWSLGAAWAFTSSAELTYTAIPDWLETIGVMFSMVLLLPVATIVVDVVSVIRERTEDLTDRNRYSLQLVYIGVGLFAALPVLNLIQALRASGGVVGFTDWVYGFEVVALLGAFSAWLFAYIFHVAPPMESADARRVQLAHVWLTLGGVVIAAGAMLLGGLITGVTWAGGDAAGVVAAGDGFESTADILAVYDLATARVVGLMLYAVAQTLLFSYAATAWFLEADWNAVLAADPELDAETQDVNAELEVDAETAPTWNRIRTVAILVGVGAFLLTVLLPALEAESADASIRAEDSRIYVEDSDVAIGRDVYVREGCGYCHTQAVRPIQTDVGLGAVSIAGDYAHEQPVQLGVARMGPDLMDAGGRGGITADDLTDPRSDRDWSTMPSYDYLSDSDLEAVVAYVNGLK
jgi:cytochrome c oxidase cbb3-type subunit I/II